MLFTNGHRSTALAMVALMAALLGCNESTDGVATGGPSADVGTYAVLESIGLLLVVDNSPSMREFQFELASGIAAMDDVFDSVRVVGGVVTTDVSDRSLVVEPGPAQSLNCFEPLNPPACVGALSSSATLASRSRAGDSVDDSPFAQQLACRAQPGDCGNGFDRGLEAGTRALEATPALTGTDALIIVYFSDEDDCSNSDGFTITRDADCYANELRDRLVPVADFVERIAALRPDGIDSVWVVGIVGPEDGAPPQSDDHLNVNDPRNACPEASDRSARDGERYREFCEQFGERCVGASVCETDFEPALRAAFEDVHAAFGVPWSAD